MAPPQPPPQSVHVILDGHKGPVNVARYAKGSAKYILTGGQDRTVRLWNAGHGGEIKTFAAHGYEVLSVTVSHDNAKFASSGGDRSVFLWDVATGVTTRRIAGHMGKIYTVEFNEDATVVASAINRQAIQVLDEARDAVQTLHIGSTTIITGSVDGHVRTYDLRKGELRSDFIGRKSRYFNLFNIVTEVLSDPVTSVVPTQDGQTVLVTTLDSHIRLMDASSGKMLNDFVGHSNTSYRCRACFSHDEANVVCGDEKGQIWAWDLLDAKVLPPNPPPQAHQRVITWTEYHPTDANEFFTSSADGTVKVWRSPDTSS
ncbi:hypothetical protein C0992_003850 [Termitomyces sp. T32_za158]|nr:hypothetical protein C0992_003850 [Termitomyces sp. T32_za158]